MKTQIVKFQNTQIVCPIIDNEPYVLVKSVIDGIGLNYDTAISNLNNNERLKRYLAEWQVMSAEFDEITCRKFDISFGYSYTVIPVRKVAAWLYSIQIGKVKEPARSKLIKFQEKCDDVLFEYFFGRPQESTIDYLARKQELMDKKRTLQARISELNEQIGTTEAGQQLYACKHELKAVKQELDALDENQFGMGELPFGTNEENE